MNPLASAASRRRLTSLWRAFTIARRFAVDLAPHRVSFAMIALLSLLAIGGELLRPWPIQWIFDNALVRVGAQEHDPWFVLWIGLAAALAITLSRAALDYAAALITQRVGQAVTRNLRARVFARLTELSPRYHAQHKTGDLLVRLMGDVPMVRSMLVDSAVALATRAVLVVGTLCVMFWMDWLLTAAMLVVLPVFLLVVGALSRQMTEIARKQRKKEGRLADYLHEAIAATPVIQSLGRASHVLARFSKSNRAQARAELKAARVSARMSASVESLFGVATAIALGLGSWRVLSGHLSPGELLAFLSYVRSLLKPARTTGKHSDRVGRGVACAERLLSILNAKIDVQSPPNAIVAPLTPRQLSLEQVRFRYVPAGYALCDVTAHFEIGKLYCVFGKSGSGKSTIAALALRLFDPDEGRVAIDGIDLRQLDLGTLRDRCGLCMQDAVLFGDTIRENLLLGRPDATDDELWAALRAAAADPFVQALPLGLDTELGSAGSGLSGGERRRIALARTLLRDAPLLIVDEPFAGLDALAAMRVRTTLAELARTRIVVVIAHDLDHLEAFDEVVFLAEGRVIDSGTHAELSARNAAYRRATRADSRVSAP